MLKPEYLRGDVNNDGEVSVEDAQITLNAYVEIMAGMESGLTWQQGKAADVDENNNVSVDDAQNILLYYVHNTLSGTPTTWEELVNPHLNVKQFENNTPQQKSNTSDYIFIDSNGARNIKLNFDHDYYVSKPVIAPFRWKNGNYYIAKTDIWGRLITNNNGEILTEICKDPGNIDYSINYMPRIQTSQAMWLDITQKKDYIFDGNLLAYEIHVADNAPDGIFPFEICFADFSNYSANTDKNGIIVKNIDTINGYICVNKDTPKIKESGTSMTLSAETLSVKPGDTVRLHIRISNNPGIVAFSIRVQYDANIITINKAAAGSDLAKQATLTTRPLD